MRNKSKLNKLKKQYFKIPNRIFDMSLPAQAIALYAYLAKQPEDFNPAVSVMAKALRLSKPTVIKYVKELKDRNIIRCYEQGRERVISKYEFIPSNEWENIPSSGKIETTHKPGVES
jgi:DNA-binding MarR family transcriptional regulator